MPPEQNTNFDSTNINNLWLQNIYENIKNIEVYERLGREGCSSIFEYLQIPFEQRSIILADTQYKNMKLIISEMLLILPDLSPVIESTTIDLFYKKLNKISEIIHKKNLFVVEQYSASKKRIISSKVTPFFEQTLQYLSFLRKEIINSIAHLLYIKPGEENVG